MNHRTFPILALVAALLLVLNGCGESPPSSGGTGTSGGADDRKASVHQVPAGETPKLAFITNNPSEFWKIAAKGLEKFEKETGVKVDLKQPPNGKVEEQKKILEDLISQGYHGIAISPIAPKDQVRDLDKAAEKLNVVCQDSDAPDSKRLAYIGTNNFEAGKALGEQLKKILPDGGKLAVFVGTFSADNATQRFKGIEAALKGSKIEIVAKKEDNKDMNKARTNVEDVINAFPDVSVLAGLWSYNTPSIAAAVNASPRKGKVLIAGFDEEDATLEGIEKGEIAFTVVQKPFEFGYQSAKLLHALCTKGASALPANPFVDTGIDVIDSKNVKGFKEKLAELKK
jgi:ribose transport system substrate-binding protein